MRSNFKERFNEVEYMCLFYDNNGTMEHNGTRRINVLKRHVYMYKKHINVFRFFRNTFNVSTYVF